QRKMIALTEHEKTPSTVRIDSRIGNASGAHHTRRMPRSQGKKSMSRHAGGWRPYQPIGGRKTGESDPRAIDAGSDTISAVLTRCCAANGTLWATTTLVKPTGH